jgi:hypothetical protein
MLAINNKYLFYTIPFYHAYSLVNHEQQTVSRPYSVLKQRDENFTRVTRPPAYDPSIHLVMDDPTIIYDTAPYLEENRRTLHKKIKPHILLNSSAFRLLSDAGLTVVMSIVEEGVYHSLNSEMSNTTCGLYGKSVFITNMMNCEFFLKRVSRVIETPVVPHFMLMSNAVVAMTGSAYKEPVYGVAYEVLIKLGRRTNHYGRDLISVLLSFQPVGAN